MLKKTVVSVVLAGVGAAAFLAWTSSASTGPALIRITSTQTRYAGIDTGRLGRSPGDMEVIRQLLFNRRITPTAIGRSEIECTFTFGKARICRATYFLAKGKIVVGGSIGNRDIYELAIVGGTGLYDNARGSLTAIRTARGPRREFLIFRLAG
jgi:hypothetical protein